MLASFPDQKGSILLSGTNLGLNGLNDSLRKMTTPVPKTPPPPPFLPPSTPPVHLVPHHFCGLAQQEVRRYGKNANVFLI